MRGHPLGLSVAAFTRPVYWVYSKQEITDVKELRGKEWISPASVQTGTLL